MTAACAELAADVLVIQENWRTEGQESLAGIVAPALGYQVAEVFLAEGILCDPKFPALHNPSVLDAAQDHQPSWGPRPFGTGADRALRLDGSTDRLGRVLGPPSDRGYSRGKWGFAVLTRLPVVSTSQIELGKLNRDPAKRSALAVTVDAGSSQLTVVGTHLSHITHGSLIQLRKLRSALGEAVSGPSAIMGDMNMWGPPVEAFLSPYKRAAKLKTWPSWNPHHHLDHILISPGIRVNRVNTRRLSCSDHLPVVAELCIGD